MTVDARIFEQRLRKELAQLGEAIAQATAASVIVELDQSSIGRVSRIDALQQQAMAQGVRERQQLRKRKLEAALARVAGGDFGSCCDCGVDLESERLDADPAAVFCADCAEQRESR